MTTFVGTNFKRDVALNEPTIATTEFPVFEVEQSEPATFITFSDNDASSITSVVIESISLQGQTVDAHNFTVSTKGSGTDPDVLGTYNVKATVNGEAIAFSCPVEVTTADIVVPIAYKAGKQIITLPVSGNGIVTFDSGTHTCNAAISSIANVYVQFDDIGKPDASWNASYTFVTTTAKIIKITIDEFTNPAATTSGFSFGYEKGDQATDINEIKSLIIKSLDITCTSHTPATKTTSGEIQTTSITVNVDKMVATTGTDDEIEITDASFTMTAAASVTIPLKFLDTVSTLEAIQNPSTASSITFTASANPTIGTYTLKTSILTITNGHSPVYGHYDNSIFSLVPAFATLEAAADTANPTLNMYFIPKDFSFDEHLRFRDASKADIVTIASGWTYYDNIIEPQASGILNINKDAGFIIPVAEDGTISSKYVRISDLYQKLLASKSADVVDLADRLHALEVAARYTTSDVLEDDTEPEAIRLLGIKEKYSVLDISEVV